ncbi:MAG: ScyD/ScyE family protein [Chloroflexota bacterium]
MRSKLILLLSLFVLAVPVFAQDDALPAPQLDGKIVLQGLNGPQGVYVADDGSVYVIDSGVGGEETIPYVNTTTQEPIDAKLGQTSRVLRLTSEGGAEEVALLPSVATDEDLMGGARLTELNGVLYATVGTWNRALGEKVTIDHFDQVVRLGEAGIETAADLWAHERANNPDGTDNIESHPYGITSGADGRLYVADAAANALIAVNVETGETETVAVFEGLPGAFPSATRKGALITDPVPTGVAIAENGMIYVSLLSGAPFIPGSAKVVQVAEDGTVSDFATGLTMLTDLQMGSDGNLYATSFGMFTQQGPVPNSGSVIRILKDGAAETVIAGLPFATALGLDANGNGYVAINGAAIPNAGMVVYYEGLTAIQGMPLPAMQAGS